MEEIISRELLNPEEVRQPIRPAMVWLDDKKRLFFSVALPTKVTKVKGKKTLTAIEPSLWFFDDMAVYEVGEFCEIFNVSLPEKTNPTIIGQWIPKTIKETIMRKKGSGWAVDLQQLKTKHPHLLLADLIKTLKNYVEFPSKYHYFMVALWIMGTYFFELFPAYPYLHFYGVKGSGKTTALQLINATAFNPIFANNISGAALFRLIETAQPVLLIDEVENLHKDPNKLTQNEQTLLNVLLGGYKRDTSMVYRVNKDNMGLEQFKVYGPKALAGTQTVPATLSDRTILIQMQRTKDKSKASKSGKISPTNAEFELLRENLIIYALENASKVHSQYTQLRSMLEHDNITPIAKALAEMIVETLYRSGEGLRSDKPSSQPSSTNDANIKPSNKEILRFSEGMTKVNVGHALTLTDTHCILYNLHNLHTFTIWGYLGSVSRENTAKLYEGCNEGCEGCFPIFTIKEGILEGFGGGPKKIPLEGNKRELTIFWTNAFEDLLRNSALFKSSPRSVELFLPLLSIALSMSPMFIFFVLRAMSLHNETRKRDELLNLDAEILLFIYRYLKESGGGFILLKELVSLFKAEKEVHWITNRWFSAQLRKLGLIEVTKHTSEGNMVYISLAKVKDVMERLGIETEDDEDA